MHKWTWSLAAVALLGLASGCKERTSETPGPESGSKVVSGNQGDETPNDEQSITEGRPDLTGGEDLADQEIYGTVTGMAAGSVTVRDRGGTTMTLVLDEDTRFLRQGQQAARGQLREGMQVRAAYDEDEGHYEATTVELLQGASAPQGK
ncbi:hypothetical protein ATI61_104721 [Archangium gephyra]|uniref:DUF5666 domain-containing protein n=1 Tax=Archangium gephyra TaxID=48 RepID=A0AAC8Q2V7_9BACT|nr:DUF5666 domain-containing protein [Archangium gephyra]AKI99856.1 Hypothetical protein AA314_01483 [Archangium gephyra]REG33430.1 hypothetical protein ATI61_104721 [Archangium gephyra]